MDAYPLLARIARLLERHNLEVVLIGNAAAALQGAPVTTLDFDFLFRRTPANVRKLSAIAAELQAVLMKPHYPVSKRAEITWSIRPWKNPVIPLAVELRLLHVQPFHNLVWDFYSCWIDLRIKAGLDSQSGFGCGIPNQVHDDLVTF